MNSPEKLEAALDIVRERSHVLVEALKLQMGPDGEVYGMFKLEGAEFVAAYLDMQDHQVILEPIDPENPDMSPNGQLVQRLLPQFVIMDPALPPPPIVLEHVNSLIHLEVLNPQLYAKLQTQYRNEYAKIAERVA